MGCCGGCGGEDKAKANQQAKNEDNTKVNKQSAEKPKEKSQDKK